MLFAQISERIALVSKTDLKLPIIAAYTITTELSFSLMALMHRVGPIECEHVSVMTSQFKNRYAFSFERI